MKKLRFILIGVCCLILCACASGEKKEVKSLSDFSTACSNLGFTVNDNKVNYPEEYITGTMMANMDDMQIQMFVYSDQEYANKVLDNSIESFMQLKSTGNIITKDKGSNYYKYMMISNGYYMVAVRVDNTLIFSKTLLDNKDTIEKILNELNY